MRKTVLLLLCIAMLLAACGVEENTVHTLPDPGFIEDAPNDEPNDEPTEEPESETQLLAVSVPAATERFIHEDGTELFSYTSQHMQFVFPDAEVADKVILDFLNRVDASRTDADSILSSAQNDYTDADTWFPYFYQIIYSPMRVDHGVLSLFGMQHSYSGGIHGSKSCLAANYDLLTGDVLTLGSIMHMNADKEDFIKIIIEKLNEIADEAYLYENFEEGVRSRLGGDENLYEDFYFSSTGLCFFFSPYEIAPYSSGIITIEIPYSELPGMIYDGYFPAERELIAGSMHTGAYMQTDMEQFNNMAEVTLETGKEIMVAYPEGRVEDIRITIPGDGMNMPDYTVFAAFEMSDKDAIVISLSEESIGGIQVSYFSDSKNETIPLSE